MREKLPRTGTYFTSGMLIVYVNYNHHPVYKSSRSVVLLVVSAVHDLHNISSSEEIIVAVAKKLTMIMTSTGAILKC